MSHDPQDYDARTAGHEPDVVNSRTVVFWGVILFVTMLFSFGSVLLFKEAVDRTLGENPTTGLVSKDDTPVPPGIAVLNPDQAAELVQLRESQHAWLDGYAWEDKSAGVARVPIARAIAIIEAKGLPAFPPSPVTAEPLSE